MAGNVTRLQRKNSFHPEAERSATLPAHYYYDPDIARREKEEVFYKTWQFVGYRRDVGEVGSYLTATIVDQPIFVVRAKDGKLRAFYNVCMHRGHILLEGTGNTRMITCPFHAWTYDLDGNLKAAGNSENVTGFDAGDFCLPEIQVEAFLHMVFVNLDAGAPSLASQVVGMEAEVRETVHNLDDLHFARRDRYDIKCNWKFIFDGLECYHCPHIHPEATSSLDWTLRKSWEYGIWQRHSNPIRGDTGDNAERPYRVEASDPQRGSNIWYLWPNLILISHWGLSNFKMMHILPAGPETAVQHVDSFCLSDPPTESDISGMNRFRDVAQAQDIHAMELQQLGVHARGYQQGRLMVDAEHSWRSEHAVHHYNKLLWEALNGPTY
jgi:phenylpropionate dioxygenase-like ring-hydroxylating dioxygenase large terminal subunit